VSRSERQTFWFAAAWVFLVIVVALGFWLTLRLIEENKDQAEKAARISAQIREQRVMDLAAICRLELELHPEERDAVIEAFANAGVPCSADTEGP
jgi:hypothetical protein